MRKRSFTIKVAVTLLLLVCLGSFFGCTKPGSPDNQAEKQNRFVLDDWKVEILNRNAAYIPFGRVDYAESYYFDEFLEVGASGTAELLEFLHEKFPSVTAPILTAQFGCSTFSASAADGDRLFGRNFDYRAYSPAVVVRTPSREGVYATISTCSLGFLGYTESNVRELDAAFDKTQAYMLAPYVPLDGINEKGLAMAVLLLEEVPITSSTSKPNITTTTAIRMVLDYCATVDEAIAMLQKYDMHTDDTAFHFQLADASGVSAVIEYSQSGKMFVTRSETEPLICTNHYVSDDLSDSKANADSERRKTSLEAALASTSGEVADTAAAMTLLKSVSKPTITRWSSVYNLTARSVEICISANYSTTYSFDFSA